MNAKLASLTAAVGAAEACFAEPGRQQAQRQQSQPDEAEEQRQHADAAHHRRVGAADADVVVAGKAGRTASERMVGTRGVSPAFVATRRTEPPVASASGARSRAVEITSWYSRGFGGPTLTKAVSLPSPSR